MTGSSLTARSWYDCNDQYKAGNDVIGHEPQLVDIDDDTDPLHVLLLHRGIQV